MFFASLLLAFIVGLFLLSEYIFSDRASDGDFNDQSSSSLHFSERQKITTPCRTVFPKSEKNLKNLMRIEKLNQLMNKPIDWFFEDIYGQMIDFYCLRDRKILIVNFWATWCPPCVKELSSLSRLAEKNKNKIFVVALSTEDKQSIVNFVTQSFSDLSPQLKWVYISKKNKAQYFPEDLLPVTYIFNKQGLLKAKELGARDWSDKRLVQQILNEF